MTNYNKSCSEPIIQPVSWIALKPSLGWSVRTWAWSFVFRRNELCPRELRSWTSLWGWCTVGRPQAQPERRQNNGKASTRRRYYWKESILCHHYVPFCKQTLTTVLKTPENRSISKIIRMPQLHFRRCVKLSNTLDCRRGLPLLLAERVYSNDLWFKRRV